MRLDSHGTPAGMWTPLGLPADSSFTVDDLAVTSTTGSVTTSITPVGTDDTTYTVTITGMSHSGTIEVSVPAGSAYDTSNNKFNEASTSTDNIVTYDVTPPTVTINQKDGQLDPTRDSTINFTVVFSEPVTDFATGDVTLTGSAGATTATVTAVGTDGKTYDVAVSGMTANGTVIAGIAPPIAPAEVIDAVDVVDIDVAIMIVVTLAIGVR